MSNISAGAGANVLSAKNRPKRSKPVPKHPRTPLETVICPFVSQKKTCLDVEVVAQLLDLWVDIVVIGLHLHLPLRSRSDAAVTGRHRPPPDAAKRYSPRGVPWIRSPCRSRVFSCILVQGLCGMTPYAMRYLYRYLKNRRRTTAPRYALKLRETILRWM